MTSFQARFRAVLALCSYLMFAFSTQFPPTGQAGPMSPGLRGAPAIDPLPPIGFGAIFSAPAIAVSPVGLSTSGVTLWNNGAPFGPDSAPGGTATTTGGIQEALNYAATVYQEATTPAGAALVVLLPGSFHITNSAGVSIPQMDGLVLTGAGHGPELRMDVANTGGILSCTGTNIPLHVQNLFLVGRNNAAYGLYLNMASGGGDLRNLSSLGTTTADFYLTGHADFDWHECDSYTSYSGAYAFDFNITTELVSMYFCTADGSPSVIKPYMLATYGCTLWSLQVQGGSGYGYWWDVLSTIVDTAGSGSANACVYLNASSSACMNSTLLVVTSQTSATFHAVITNLTAGSTLRVINGQVNFGVSGSSTAGNIFRAVGSSGTIIVEGLAVGAINSYTGTITDFTLGAGSCVYINRGLNVLSSATVTQVTPSPTGPTNSPASTVALQNTSPYPLQITLANVTGVSALTLNGVAIGYLTGTVYRMNPGDKMVWTWLTTQPTYYSQPV